MGNGQSGALSPARRERLAEVAPGLQMCRVPCRCPRGRGIFSRWCQVVPLTELLAESQPVYAIHVVV